MAILEMTDDPKEDIDIEEEEKISQQERVVKAPCPHRSSKTSVPATLTTSTGYFLIVFEEREVESYGGQWGKESYYSVLEIATHVWSYDEVSIPLLQTLSTALQYILQPLIYEKNPAKAQKHGKAMNIIKCQMA